MSVFKKKGVDLNNTSRFFLFFLFFLFYFDFYQTFVGKNPNKYPIKKSRGCIEKYLHGPFQRISAVSKISGNFNLRGVVWQDGPNKNRTMLSQSEKQAFIDIMKDRGLEQMT